MSHASPINTPLVSEWLARHSITLGSLRCSSTLFWQSILSHSIQAVYFGSLFRQPIPVLFSGDSDEFCDRTSIARERCTLHTLCRLTRCDGHPIGHPMIAGACDRHPGAWRIEMN